MRERRTGKSQMGVLLLVVVRRDQRPEHGQEEEEAEDDGARERRRTLQQAAPVQAPCLGPRLAAARPEKLGGHRLVHDGRVEELVLYVRIDHRLVVAHRQSPPDGAKVCQPCMRHSSTHHAAALHGGQRLPRPVQHAGCETDTGDARGGPH
jgi:hypothetical protein